jgi:hypothetical protein
LTARFNSLIIHTAYTCLRYCNIIELREPGVSYTTSWTYKMGDYTRKDEIHIVELINRNGGLNFFQPI